MEFTMELTITFLAFLAIVKGVKFVPQQQVWIVERMGQYRVSMEAGLNFLIPFIDNISYRHSLKEEAVDIPSQTAITKDNVTLIIDGILYLKITDPKQASYGVGDARYAITQMAQTTMRSELGKMTLDKTFLERDNLNVSIVQSINEASVVWGIQCLRYEIKDITPPDNVRQAMELQVAAERQKRAEVLDSEGKRQSQINIAEGIKQEVVLKSEAAMTDQINRAKGEAEAILEVAKATAEGIELVAVSIEKSGGEKAVALRLAEQYIEAFSKLAKENNTLILPAKTDDAGSMVAQALSIFNSIQGQVSAGKKDIS
ncbi:MAG TPA: paraslipin [Rhodospirillales bacterium]|nr:paraslipin [Rhodospirillales bacterium]